MNECSDTMFGIVQSGCGAFCRNGWHGAWQRPSGRDMLLGREVLFRLLPAIIHNGLPKPKLYSDKSVVRSNPF